MNNNKYMVDKKKVIREMDHLTRPPRLNSNTKNTRMNPVRKSKKVGKK